MSTRAVQDSGNLMHGAVRKPVYVFEGFRLDAQRRVLLGVDGQPVPLTPRLFDTLLYLVERPGQLLNKDELLAAIWPHAIVEEHNLNKTISTLRRTLGEKPGEHRFIVTKPGLGYRFVATVTVAPERVSGEDPTRADRGGAEPVHESAAETGAAVGGTATLLPPARRHWVYAAWGMAAVVAAVAMFGFLGRAPEPQLRVTPWSVKKGVQWFPVWSPDGTSTAFTTFGAAPNEPAELVIRTLNEPVPRSILARSASAPGGVTQWTTTGKILLLERDGLLSISPVGGSPERVVSLDFPALGIPQWFRMAHVSADGSTLAAFARDGDHSVAVWTAAPPSATLERYAPAPFAGAAFLGGPFLRFSPSGRQILLFFYALGRGAELWLMPFPADARHPPRRVLEELPIAGDGLEFSWLPDDRHVVLSVVVGGDVLRRQMYVADTRSGRYRLLGVPLDNPALPVASPDGKRLIVDDARNDYDIVTLDLRTATPTTLIATDRMEGMPAWAAGTGDLVYATDRAGAWEVWVHRDGHPDRPLVTAQDLPTGTEAVWAPTLSPEGARVIFHRFETGGHDARLWIRAVAGGAPEPLTSEQLVEAAGSWSPDGEWYVYSARPSTGGKAALKKVRTTGRAAPETLLEDLDETDIVPIFSPDGRWVLVAHQGLTLVAADGGMSRKLANETMPCAFADREPLLYCIRGTRGTPMPIGEYALVVLDLDGNVTRTTRVLPPAYRPLSPLNPALRLSPTPDRMGVTYSIASTSQTLWLLDGLDKVPLP